MIGIVVVSHSPALARAAIDLALEMVVGDKPQITTAAGTGDGSTGTDAVRIAEAIGEVSSPDGVLVLMDLGSAILSAGLALELLTDDSVPVRLSAAPFFEGLQAAVVRAAGGASLEEVDREAVGALAGKQAQLQEAGPDERTAAPEGTPDASAEVTLTNPDGLHARPAAALVAAATGWDARLTLTNLRSGAGPAAANSPTALAALAARAGDPVRIEATGPDAAAAVAALRELIAQRFGEPAVASTPRPPVPAGPAGPLGVSAGRVAGPVVVLRPHAAEPDPTAVLVEGERESAKNRLTAAANAVAAALTELAARSRPPASDVIAATAAVATDPELLDAARRRIDQAGRTPQRAVWDQLAEIAEAYTDAGGALAERVVDLRDVRDRIIAELTGGPAGGIPATETPYVLVATDLAPADTAVLDPAVCLAIVTEQGGPTSHTAILARSLGLPAVVGAAGATGLAEGTMLLVDGGTGELVIDPDPEQLTTVTERSERPALHGPGATADGHPVQLLANVASADSVAGAIGEGAEGVGLFRTEFGFLDRAAAPDIPEQTEAYRRVFAAFPGRKVVIRTLDAGADKPLPFLTAAGEPNPALGVRGYRTALTHPQVLDDQLAAIASAARAEHAKVWVMAPMISTPQEAADFAARCHRAGLGTAGVMIETPSAALLASEVLAEVDFVSLGTNDLAQYTMAADRTLGDLASLNDPWQPAVLRLVRLVGAAGAAAGKSVGVCGEAAADPELAIVLVGLGVDSLSMTPRALGTVGAALRGVTLQQCRAAAEAACAARTAAEAKSAAARAYSLI